MNNIEFFTNICQSVLNPLDFGYVPITEEEKLDILNFEMDMEYDAAMYPWPPDPEPDWALEL